MRRFLWLMPALFFGIVAVAQNPATVFTNPYPNKTITLPCGTSCTNISIGAPNIKQTTDYIVSRPAYLPYAFLGGGATDNNIIIDDNYSVHIPFPFAFSWCFFGLNYPEFVVGTNGVVTFDVSNSGESNAYPLESGGNPIPIPYAGGSPGSISPAYYPKASIMGPYHDINPNASTKTADTRIEWRVEGTAPRRRFVISYNYVPLFQCEDQFATHQMVLYENTGIIEVYIKDKPVCPTWNEGLAILGLQNENQNVAVAVPGKNATVWGTNGMDSAYRFTPSGGVSKFKRAQLLVNNVVIATNTTDTATNASAREVLDINFNNLCPTADSTAYVIRVVYGSCNNPNIETTFTDTVFVKKSTFTATALKTDATCDANGSITVNATGGTAPYEYSINGTTWQASNQFNNLAPGSYTVIARQTTAPTNCPTSIPQTIGLTGSITVNAGLDTTICSGASFTRTIVSTATSYTWTATPGGAQTPTTSPSFQLAPTTTTDYTITGIRGNCTAQDNLRVTVSPTPTIDAGPPASITLGQSYTIPATGSQGTYVWTPSTGLSSASILQPVATPQVTTTYTVQVTSNGCSATSSVVITVIPYCIKVMEAFTPNGDGINDFWLITQGNCLKTAKAQVFNRNGGKVYESNNYRNDWNGTYNGKPVPDGTYYYIVSYTLLDGKSEVKRGSLTILR